MKKEHEKINEKKKNRPEPKGRAFRVRIRETLERTVTVYENELKDGTPDEAVRLVSDWWHDSQIILGPEDFTDVEFLDAEAEDGSPENTEEGGGD